jgi:dihydroflavonol-4-reductase
MILVTGGTGFIGSHLVERLLARGERVRALVRKPALLNRGPLNKASAPLGVVRGDLVTGAGLAQSLNGVDTVIHLAGVTKALSAADYHAGNVTATENLARAIAEQKRPIRMVHVSSLAAIGPGADATPVAEDAAPRPITPYGKSKLEGERVVRALLPEAVIVRPPVVYGPRDTDVFQLLKSIRQGIVVQISGGDAGGDRWFSAIYAMDLADGMIAAAGASGAAGRTYYLAHSVAVSWNQLGAIAARIMGCSPRVVRVPVAAALGVGYCAELWSRLTRKPGIVSRDKVTEAECTYWICDTRRAKAEIGFAAPTNLEQGLASTLAWYREAGWLKWG